MTALSPGLIPPIPSWSNYLAERGRASAVDGDSSLREGGLDASPEPAAAVGFLRPDRPTDRQAERRTDVGSNRNKADLPDESEHLRGRLPGKSRRNISQPG